MSDGLVPVVYKSFMTHCVIQAAFLLLIAVLTDLRSAFFTSSHIAVPAFLGTEVRIWLDLIAIIALFLTLGSEWIIYTHMVFGLAALYETILVYADITTIVFF